MLLCRKSRILLSERKIGSSLCPIISIQSVCANRIHVGLRVLIPSQHAHTLPNHRVDSAQSTLYLFLSDRTTLRGFSIPVVIRRSWNIYRVVFLPLWVKVHWAGNNQVWAWRVPKPCCMMQLPGHPSVSLSVRYKPVLHRSGWMDRARMWHRGYPRLIKHCIIREFGYLQKLGHFHLELCPKLWT